MVRTADNLKCDCFLHSTIKTHNNLLEILNAQNFACMRSLKRSNKMSRRISIQDHMKQWAEVTTLVVAL
jgi:hypothetical protein